MLHCVNTIIITAPVDRRFVDRSSQALDGPLHTQSSLHPAAF